MDSLGRVKEWRGGEGRGGGTEETAGGRDFCHAKRNTARAQRYTPLPQQMQGSENALGRLARENALCRQCFQNPQILRTRALATAKRLPVANAQRLP